MGEDMALLAQHCVFQSRDIDEGEAFASRIWEENRSFLTDGQYGLRWSQLDGEKVGFSYVEHDCAVDLTAQGPLSDHFRLFIHQNGVIGHSVNGRDFVSDPEKLVAHAPSSDLKLTIEPFRLLLLSFDGQAVRRAMAQRFRTLSPYQDWLGAMPQAPSLAALRAVTDWLVPELDRPGSILAVDGPARKHAEGLLLSLFVEGLSLVAPNEAVRCEDLSVAQVRRAESWIEAHLTDVISIDDIAAASGVGVRSLQRSFRRIHACSPQQFVMRRRLDAARARLLGADTDDTVTEIATSLGFFELSRFAYRYREHFGEVPSATLARRRR